MQYRKGDKVKAVANDWVPLAGTTFHHFEIGETVRVVHVTADLIYCRNSKGLEQALRPKYIEPIKNN